MVSGVGMGVGVGGAGSKGDGVASSGDVGVAGGAARCRNCCRFPDDIFGEYWEELPYHLPFTFNIDNVFLVVGLERKGG